MSKGMDERKKASDIAAIGVTRIQALRESKAQLRAWKLVMPPHEPLVSDFGLADFYKTGLIEYWIANEIEQGYCGKFLFIFDGQTCPLHWHKEKHETFFIIRGKVQMSFDGAVLDMQPGDCLPVPPGTPHSFTGKGPALLLEVSKPCLIHDNVFENPRIPLGCNYDSRSRNTASRKQKSSRSVEVKPSYQNGRYKSRL
jgi:mannose-6-phosphate isomerase-like protein (cupin superfamily)